MKIVQAIKNSIILLKFIGNENIIAKIFWVQANNSIICENFCIGFIDFMLAGKKLTHFTSMFSPYVFTTNDRIFLGYFKHEWNWQNELDWLNRIQIDEIAKVESYFNLN